MELVLKLGSHAIDSDAMIRPLFEKFEVLEGFEPERYDLNSMENWRGWDIERAVVDALTQRTQLFRVGGAGENLAMVALGKHGEPPTAIVRWEGAADFEELFEDFELLHEAWLSSQKWQETLAGAGIAVRVPMIAAWPREQVPEWVASFDVERHGSAVVLDMRMVEPMERVASLATHFTP